MRLKVKSLIASLLSLILLLSSVTVFAADEDTARAYALTVSITGNGTVDVSGTNVTKTEENTYSVVAGTEVTVTAVPGEGSELAEMIVDEEIVSDSFYMPGKDAALDVTFSEIGTPEDNNETDTGNLTNDITDGGSTNIPEEENQDAEVPELTEGTGKSDETEEDRTEAGEKSDDIAARLDLAEELGVSEWMGEDGYLVDGYFAGKSDLELTQTGVVPLIRNCLTTPKLTRAVSSYEKVTYMNISTAKFAVDGNLAFCLEYAKPTPPAGTWTGPAQEQTNASIRAAMWFGYGGPAQYGFSSDSQAVLLTAAAASYYYSGQMPYSSITSGQAQSTGFTAYYDYIEAHKYEVPSSFRAYAVSTGASTQDLGYWVYEPTGYLNLKKVSANPELTDNNSCYSLEGAVYGVYSDSGCTAEVATLTTDASGISNTVELDAGTYYVKETKVPKGYALDTRVHTVTVTSGQTYTLSVTDLPQSDPVWIFLGKVDEETTENMPQGSASLINAEFSVKYYDGFYDTDPAESGEHPVRTWVLRTDEDGFSALDDAYKVSGDDFYYMSNGDVTLPLGTITIQETKAPNGYLLNDEVFIRQITTKGTAESVNTYNAPTIPENVIRGDIQIIKYGETNDETDDSAADIKRPLEGVKFHLESKTTGDVYTIITDEQGIASTTQLGNERGGLPFDTYIVTEESPYPEYDLVAPFEVTISEEGKTLYYILRNDTVDAPVQVVKKDATTGKVVPVAGAQFQILDEDKKPVSMTVSHYPSLVETDTFETDGTGSFVLPEKLEHGTYYLHEIEAPEGYLLGSEDIRFTVDQEYQWDDPLIVEYTDAPAMGRIEIIKTDSETGDVLSGTQFEIRAEEDIVTPDGTMRAAKGEVVDTITTDRFGRAQSKDLYLGKYDVVETKQPSGYVLPNQSWAVELTYQDQHTAIVTETLDVENDQTKVIINKKETGSDKALPGVKFVVWNNSVAPESIGMIDEKLYVTDEKGQIILQGLVPGEYCVAEAESIPGYAFDPEKVYEFTVTEDGRINGKGEYVLTIENEKTKITETNAIEVLSDTQSAYPFKDVTIIDTVSMANLMPGEEYVLKGVLADQLTGIPLRENNSLTGDEITVEQEFLATEGSMDVEVTFEHLDLSVFAGRKIVVYEYLHQDGTEISVHNDLDDEKQQIQVMEPKLKTTAIDVASGTHESIAKKDVTIRDNVEYFDIIPGLKYTLKGIVMDQATGKPLLINGKEIAAEKEVTISESDGEISMDFTLDASELNNTSVVIYEYLYYEDKLVTSHEDINDKDQTVTFKVGSLSVNLPGNGGNGMFSVKTGDHTVVTGIMLTLAGAAIVITSIIYFRRREKVNNDEE